MVRFEQLSQSKEAPGSGARSADAYVARWVHCKQTTELISQTATKIQVCLRRSMAAGRERIACQRIATEKLVVLDTHHCEGSLCLYEIVQPLLKLLVQLDLLLHPRALRTLGTSCSSGFRGEQPLILELALALL